MLYYLYSSASPRLILFCTCLWSNHTDRNRLNVRVSGNSCRRVIVVDVETLIRFGGKRVKLVWWQGPVWWQDLAWFVTLTLA